jgi:uncharacterized membrane protein
VSLAPLLNAEPAIQLHAFTAMAAFALGAVQLSAPKGTLPHRTAGWIWVALMVIVAVSSFFIHDLRIWDAWSPIHLLSVFTLAMLPLAVMHARRHRVDRHRRAMIAVFVGGDRRPVHPGARPHHARRRVRELRARGGLRRVLSRLSECRLRHLTISA